MNKQKLNLIKYFKNKTVLITGSNGVLGKRISKFFASCESNLILIDVDKKSKIKYKKSKYYPINFTDLNQIEKKN